jgi:uncharacterized protein YjbI with pentapeptide repeats
MIIGVSPNFPYGGKGTFDIHFTAQFGQSPLPVNDKVVIRRTAAARLGFSIGDTAETFIVYGDVEKGPFQLASHDGVPMGLVPGVEYAPDGTQFNCHRLEKTTTFATIHLDHTNKSAFGPSFIDNNQGILSCHHPVNFDDNASLFILDKPPVHDVFDVFFAFKQMVPGLSIIRSKGGPGCDLSYVDLTNAELSGVDLTGTNLQHANLIGAKLIGAKLGGAVLSNATLTEANLTGAILDGTDLSGAKLEGATLSADLTKAIFKAPPIFSTDPKQPTSFKNAKLNYSLIGLSWSCLDLTDASVIGMPVDLANLKATHLTALKIDLSGKTLVGADFSYAKLAKAVFNGAVLTGAVFTGADLSGAKLLSGTQLGSAHLDMANLSGAQLTGAQLIGATGVAGTNV